MWVRCYRCSANISEYSDIYNFWLSEQYIVPILRAIYLQYAQFLILTQHQHADIFFHIYQQKFFKKIMSVRRIWWDFEEHEEVMWKSGNGAATRAPVGANKPPLTSVRRETQLMLTFVCIKNQRHFEKNTFKLNQMLVQIRLWIALQTCLIKFVHQ